MSKQVSQVSIVYQVSIILSLNLSLNIASVLVETRDIWSNINLCLKEFPRAKPEGTPEGKGLYLTEYPELSTNKDIISF